MADVSGEIRLRKRSNVRPECPDKSNGEGNNDDDKVLPKEIETVASPYSLENFFWIVTALLVFYYTDFCAVVINDSRIYRTWLNIGLVLMTISLLVAFYLIVFLSFYKKVNPDEWETVHPAAIPIATGSGCASIICFLVSLWPVWSILTPLILFTLVMGVIVIIAMLPKF